MVVVNPEGETINLQAWNVPEMCEPLPKIDWSQEKKKMDPFSRLAIESDGSNKYCQINIISY